MSPRSSPHAARRTPHSRANEIAAQLANILQALAATDQQLATIRAERHSLDYQLAMQLKGMRDQVANQNRAIGALAVRLDDMLAELRRTRPDADN
jgi:flagellar biosynthesis chaperone FliJ